MKLCCTLALFLTIGVAPSAQMFRPPVPEAAVFAGGQPDAATLTADGLTIYWIASRAGGLGGRDIWMTTRPTIASPWSATAINVTALNSPSDEHAIDVRDDGREMFISSDRPGGIGPWSIWSATKTLAGWQPPTLATTAALNSTAGAALPSVTADGLEIYFTNVGLQIYRAFRPSNTASWGAPTAVAELGRPVFAPAISGDGLSIISLYSWGLSSSVQVHERPDRGTPAAPMGFSTGVFLFGFGFGSGSGQQTSDGFSYYFGDRNGISRADRILPVIYGPGGPPQVGQPFTIYVRRDAVAGQVGVIAGSTSQLALPATIPGVLGPLEINLAAGLQFWFTVGGVNPADGKYTTNVPVPPIAALAGQSVYFQGAVQNGASIWLAPSKKYTIVP